MPPETATALAAPRSSSEAAIAQLEKVVVEGNLATLTREERVSYYARVCESVGLNPLTQPFEYITLNNKLTLYAKRTATDQLRKLHGISVERLERERSDDLITVTAHGVDRRGRVDSAIGAVAIKNLTGENLANALMKAETKAKRRLTLSLAGLGWLDESEVEDVTEDQDVPVVVSRRDRVAARTARLSGGAATEQPAEAAGSSGPAARSAPACTHPDNARQANDRGVVCGACGELLAERAPEEQKARPRRRTKAEPKTQEDPDYWPARLHAVAAEKGIDHEGVRVLLAAYAEIPAGKLQRWSTKDATPEQYAAADAFLRRLEGEQDEDAATGLLWRTAVKRGLVDGEDEEAGWESLNTIARLTLGGDPDDLTPAEWLSIAARAAQGQYDKPAA